MTNRRKFLFSSALGLFGVSAIGKGLGIVKPQAANINKSAEEMRPGEILSALQKALVAFIPVSPMLEWHSYHLPMGTDGLIAEAIAREAAIANGGIWFRPLSFGLDAIRPKSELAKFGFDENDKIYGENFPELPLASEYCNVSEFKASVINRLNFLEKSGVKHAFLINHHGGPGQFDTVEQLAKLHSSDKLKVHAIKTYDYNKLTEADGLPPIGGHAGYSETLWAMAFRPELIDLTQLPQGTLSVRKTGILHDTPTIEAKWNPRNVDPKVAVMLHNSVLDNFNKFVNTASTN